MRSLYILSFVLSYACAICEIDPGCRLIPNGCESADKVCCTKGWDETCSCCLSITTSSIPETTMEHLTTKVTTETSTNEPKTSTVQSSTENIASTKLSSASSEGSSISVTTSFGSSVSVSSTGASVTVATPQFTTIITTPAALIEHAIQWLIPCIVGVVVLLVVFVCLFICLNDNIRRRITSLIQRRIGGIDDHTPQSFDLINLDPIPTGNSRSYGSLCHSCQRVTDWTNQVATININPLPENGWDVASDQWSDVNPASGDVLFDRRHLDTSC